MTVGMHGKIRIRIKSRSRVEKEALIWERGMA
jgi:hypothetical protein